MAAPGIADIKRYAGDDDSGTPPTADSGDAYGGDIDTGTELVSGGTDNVIQFTQITSSDDAFYGVLHVKNIASGSGRVDNARVANLAGAKLNTGAGQASVSSTSEDDTGVVKITGKVSAAWDPEEVTAAGTSFVLSDNTWDVDTTWRWEYLVAGVPTVPVGNISCMVDGELVAVIYGGVDGNTGATAEIQICVADAVDSPLGAGDRKTAPTQANSGFSEATFWSGGDESIAVPGDELVNSHSIAVGVKKIVPADIPASVGGSTPMDICLIGNPLAS